ncbi:MAG: hypothetical protein LCH99_08555 [Proteobacteria bacterium]|nr:hypothetical protein [Pseudomonadota bacterium]
MIRHTWADVVQRDSALREGEWAGVRSSTSAERRLVGAGWREVCFTFVFRGCGHVLRLVIHKQGQHAALFRGVGVERRVLAAVERKRFNIPEPYSTSIFSLVLTLAPGAAVELDEVRGKVRCAGCTCVMRQDGPIDSDSLQGSFARTQALQSDFFQRSA